jgi:hypothetical protein
LHALFETALEDYKKQTGIELAKHPLAERLQNCASPESFTCILRKEDQDFKEFWEKDKVLRPLKNVFIVLSFLPPAANLGLVCPWALTECSMSLTHIL